ncbi:signal peptidase I [Candidatus Saccharibacteria bacterium]|nr:MAG: signal peptidase I [Candidatus Saccharibacteria bacterium]
MKDFLGIVGFFITVFVGAILINALLFRSFSVQGPSMEPTLFTGDRLIVNRIPHAKAVLGGESYLPDRNQVIVFKNPNESFNGVDQFLVKRVIALPGERVVLQQGVLAVYKPGQNTPILPDEQSKAPRFPSSGETDTVVPEGEVFVAGDNRIGNFSLDSRNGLGTVPLENIQGPVAMRIYPFDKTRTF